jgi:hypothetical protein
MSEVQKFRKKPVVIEAIQWTGANLEEISEWSGGKVWFGFPESESRAATQQGREPVSSLWVSTLEGDLRATVCDWIIKGVQSEFYPCKPDIFAATYEFDDTKEGK